MKTRIIVPKANVLLKAQAKREEVTKKLRMNALDKFKKMYSELPVKARKELVLNAYGKRPCTLNIVWLEASQKTKTGMKMLKELGYEND